MLDLPQPDRAGLADLGRTTIRTWEWGNAANPSVLLVHGGWDHGRMWDGLAPRIANDLQRHAVAAHWLADADRIHREGPREYPSIEEMAQKRKDINTRLPYEWCLHMASHGTKRGPTGGFTWKADPLFRLGSPEPFNDEMLVAQYRTIRQPVMALSGTEPDQWSFLQPEDRARRLDAFPDVEHHLVAGAGHYIHVEQPDETIELLGAFLDK